MSTNLENSQWSQDWKTSVFIPIPKKDNAKECSSSCTIVLISHASKVILKILQARLQPFVNWELPAVITGFRKGRGTRNQIDNIPWIIGKARGFQKRKKKSPLWLDCAKAFDCVDYNCRKFLKRWECQTTLPASWEICIQVTKKQLELDVVQWTGSKLGKEYVKAVYCHPAYITYMQSTSCQMPGWMKHKLESRLPEEISITSDMQMTPPLWQKVKRN